MPVIETPAKLQGPITYGTFVVVCLDIESSIQGLTDQRALEAARALPHVKCLAFITTIGTFNYSAAVGALRLSLNFHFVGHGLPAPPQTFAAVPIAPAPAHPDTGRQPVEPNRPFPWPDCYIYTRRPFTATVSRIHHDDAPTAFIDNTQREDVLVAIFEDGRRRPGAPQTTSGPARQEPRGLPSDLLFDEDGEVEEDDDDATGNTDDAYGSSSNASSAGQSGSDGKSAPDKHVSDRGSQPSSPKEPDRAVPEPQASPRIVSGVHIHVEIWGTIRPTDELVTADEFSQTVSRLFQIEKEWVDRTVTSILAEEAAPKATAWLQGISDADKLGPPSQEDLRAPEPYEDDISPSDAVDDRMEERANNMQSRRDTGSAGPGALALPPDAQGEGAKGSTPPRTNPESGPENDTAAQDADISPAAAVADDTHVRPATTIPVVEADPPPRDGSDDLEAGAAAKPDGNSPASVRRVSVVSRMLAFVRSLFSRFHAFLSKRLI